MSGPPSRRTALRTAGAIAATAVAGCLGGENGREPGHVFVHNERVEERRVAVVVERDGERVAGGRFRVPGGTNVGLRRSGFDGDRYLVAARMADLPWKAVDWTPGTCGPEEARHATVELNDDEFYVGQSGCGPNVGFPSGGGADEGAEAADEYRVGDVTSDPTVTPTPTEG